MVEDNDRLPVFKIDKTGVHFQYDKNKGRYSVLKDGEWTSVPPADLAAMPPVPTAADERTGVPGPSPGLPPSSPGGSIGSPDLSISTATAPQSSGRTMSADAREDARFEWITLKTTRLPRTEDGTYLCLTLHDASDHIAWTIPSAPQDEVAGWLSDEEIINRNASTPSLGTCIPTAPEPQGSLGRRLRPVQGHASRPSPARRAYAPQADPRRHASKNPRPPVRSNDEDPLGQYDPAPDRGADARSHSPVYTGRESPRTEVLSGYYRSIAGP